MMIVRSQVCGQRSTSRVAFTENRTHHTSGVAARRLANTARPCLPFRAVRSKTAARRTCIVQAAQAASNKTGKVVKKIISALPIVVLIGLALVPVCMTLASALKFGAASKTYQGVGNYYDAGIPIGIKAAAACLGAIFGFIHDVGVFLFSIVTSSWVFWPMLVIGFAALLFRD